MGRTRIWGAVALALAVTGFAGVRMAVAGHVAMPPQTANCGDSPGTELPPVTGTVTAAEEGSYLFVPFDVPAGTTKVRVALSYQNVPQPNELMKHTLDLGLYGPRDDGETLWGEDEFRGWGGSSRLDACVSPDAATYGFVPGPIEPGRWAAEIGVAAVADALRGDPDGSTTWTVRVWLSGDEDHADQPWTPASYDASPARSEPGWYAGDFHVHARHSNPNDASMERVFDDAFADDGADLDFITLSDYVTTRHWDEIGRLQAHHPGKLVVRSAEVITYRGHVNNHGSADWADYRTGDVYELRPGGSKVLLRPAAAHTARDVFDEIHANGKGWAQVNHPTTFPATVPTFDQLCRGCSWEYSDAETDWSKVDAFEIHTGPAGTGQRVQGQQVGLDGTTGPNPFTPAAIEWWDRLQRAGFDITGVASSDSHKADQQDLTTSPIGEGTTVVYAPELSEQGIRRGIRAGHAYVKLFGNAGPDLRLEATDGKRRAIMGDKLKAASARFTARVMGGGSGPGPLTLFVMRDGLPYLTAPVTSEDFTFTFEGVLPGDYRLQVQRGSAIEALTNPVNLVEPVEHGQGKGNKGKKKG